MGSFSYSQTNKNKISLSKVNFNNNHNFVSSDKTTDFEEIDYTKSDKKYEVLIDGVPTYVDNLDNLPDDHFVVTDPVHQFNSLNDLPEKPDISSFDEMDETQQMAVNLFNYLNNNQSNALKEYLEKIKQELGRDDITLNDLIKYLEEHPDDGNPNYEAMSNFSLSLEHLGFGNIIIVASEAWNDNTLCNTIILKDENGNILVTFRGTDGFNDIKMDVIHGLGNFTGFSKGDTIVNPVMDQIEGIINANIGENGQIYTSGHSLGGYYAQFLAKHLHEHGTNVNGVYTVNSLDYDEFLPGVHGSLISFEGGGVNNYLVSLAGGTSNPSSFASTTVPIESDDHSLLESILQSVNVEGNIAHPNTSTPHCSDYPKPPSPSQEATSTPGPTPCPGPPPTMNP